MEILDPEQLLVCPYDDTHRIRVKRMQMHLLGCRKNHLSSPLEKCPFNASHMVYEAERRWHLATCPDRHQVHSKIIGQDQGNTGCVETPAYKPVITYGESWEDEAVESWSSQVEKPARKVEVTLTEEETRGLNARQKRQLYLKKKAELEESVKNPQSKPNGDPLRAQNPRSTGSRSMALFEQQSRAVKDSRATVDIYKDALRGPQEGKMGIGRGHTAGLCMPGPQAAPGPGPLGRGRGQALLDMQNAGVRPVQSGIWASPPTPSVGREDNSGDARHQGDAPGTESRGVESTFRGASAVSVPGRGSVGGVRTDPWLAVPGRGAGARGAGVGPPGMWPGGAAPVNVGWAGRGRGFESAVDPPLPSMGIPFGGMTSQPDSLSPAFGQMALSRGIGRGRSITTDFMSRNAGSGEAERTSESEDPERYMDAAPQVGGGDSRWTGRDREEYRVLASASSMSLGSNPEPVESWAAEMDKQKSESAISESTDSDVIEGKFAELTMAAGRQGRKQHALSKQKSEGGSGVAWIPQVNKAKAQLRKVEKKLRQVAELEAKAAKGQALDNDQKEKLSQKEDWEAEASKCRTFLAENDID